MKTFVEPTPKLALVSRLKLDPNNPRLRLHAWQNAKSITEKDIIERLCQLGGDQSPYQLVKCIMADRGFLHNAIPVVYREQGKKELLVIDGNRRVAALKMILDPSLVPSTRHGLRADCEKLNGLVPKQIYYWVTSNRSDAARIVYRAHNQGTKEWATLARYASHYDSHRKGQSVADISDFTGTPQKQVRNEINAWLLVEAMINRIQGFQIDSAGITNFERITTSYDGFSRRLGFEVSADGIYIIPDDQDFVNLIHRAYVLSAQNKGFTRNVDNNEASREQFWDEVAPKGVKFNCIVGPGNGTAEIDERKPSTASDGTPANGKPSSNPNTSAEPKPDESGHDKPKPGAPTNSRHKILSTVNNVGRKASLIYKEYLKIQEIGDCPIASAALTRSMIEITLKHHAKRLCCYTETIELQQANRSDSIENIARQLKAKIAAMGLQYSSDLNASISSCIKSITELNDVMHKDGSLSANSAVQYSLFHLTAAVERLITIQV